MGHDFSVPEGLKSIELQEAEDVQNLTFEAGCRQVQTMTGLLIAAATATLKSIITCAYALGLK